MRPCWPILFFLLVFGGLTCSPRVQSRFAETGDLELLPEQPQARGAGFEPCSNYESYIPDTLHLDHTPVKYVRVNVHFMNSSDSSRNFNYPEGIQKAEALLHAANHDIETNDKLYLPLGNDIPVLPPQYRLKLTPRPGHPDDTGVYFHYDDELYYYVMKGKHDNRSRKQVIDRYGVQLDTVLNIFLLPHHPDSVASRTYRPAYGGIALGNAVKATGWFENKVTEWDLRYVLNHEIGHVFGLSHTWSFNDGCDDTPYHPKCWNFSDTPPCDSLVSNNVMDYNAYQSAWSPCQIGKIQYVLSREDHKCRRFLEPRWCEIQPQSEIIIRDSVHWQGARDLEGNLTIRAGGVLRISCRVSMPRNAKITIEPGGLLLLDNCRIHNACGDTWQGIKIEQDGARKGRIILEGSPLVENTQSPVPRLR